MIECESKHSLPILNRGVVVSICTRFGPSVNDDICSSCPEKRGGGGLPMVQLDFPKRGELEIAACYKICTACPLFNTVSKQCRRLPTYGHPTDVYAQNPTNHCPEGHW